MSVVCTHSHVDPTGSGPQLHLSSGRTRLSLPAGTERRPTQETVYRVGVPGPSGFETQVLDLELGGWVSGRLLLLMALPCLGLT